MSDDTFNQDIAAQLARGLFERVQHLQVKVKDQEVMIKHLMGILEGEGYKVERNGSCERPNKSFSWSPPYQRLADDDYNSADGVIEVHQLDDFFRYRFADFIESLTFYPWEEQDDE